MVPVYTSMAALIIILGLAAVGGMLTEKSGVINLSIEAFMTIGAVVYALIMGTKEILPNDINQFWVFIIGGIAASLFSLLYAFMTVTLKANQTIAGIALNALALAFSLFIIRTGLNPTEGSYVEVSGSYWSLGETSASWGRLINSATILGIPLIVGLIIFVRKTKFGKHITAVGENPHAAASLGIKVEKVQYLAIMISAFFVGIAGAMFAQTTQYFYGSAKGMGFLAVALVIFGQWKPTLIMVGAVIFGATTGLFANYELVPVIDGWGTYKSIMEGVPYMVSLTVLVFTSKNSRAPKALGIPYKNSGR